MAAGVLSLVGRSRFSATSRRRPWERSNHSLSTVLVTEQGRRGLVPAQGTGRVDLTPILEAHPSNAEKDGVSGCTVKGF